MALNHVEIVVKDKFLSAAARANRSWKLLELAEIIAILNNKGAVKRLVRESFLLNPSASGLIRWLRAL